MAIKKVFPSGISPMPNGKNIREDAFVIAAASACKQVYLQVLNSMYSLVDDCLEHTCR